MYTLVADIGGTQARFRVLDCSSGECWIRHEATWPSQRFGSLAEAVACCLRQLSRLERADISSAWLAVAGPVRNGHVKFTNLPWEAHTDELRTQLCLPRIHLINDLEALAYAVPHLEEHQLLSIQPGAPDGTDGSQLVIASGTGLGLAGWKCFDDHPVVLPSEGGHCDLAPVTDRQMDLLLYLRERYAHVSYERVLSGSGLTEIHAFMKQRMGCTRANIDENTTYTPANVLEDAQKEDPLALATVELFTELLGSFAGNCALQWTSTAGVYLAGGVALRLYPYIVARPFTIAFQNKGRMQPLMTRIPVKLISDHQAGLEGISWLATAHQPELAD